MGIFSGVTPHTDGIDRPRDRATPSEATWHPVRGCNIAIKSSFFIKKKKKQQQQQQLIERGPIWIMRFYANPGSPICVIVL